MENVVPCCFQNFVKQNIDLNDAQQVLVDLIIKIKKNENTPIFLK
jgi:hypothetical protein